MEEKLYIFLWASFCSILFCARMAESCSCMPAHPQQHYCDSDFVVLARIKKQQISNDTREYKIRVRKEYKMSEKAHVALKGGRLRTSMYEETCGVKLQVTGLYVIAGKVVNLQARVNLCGFHEKWEDLTRRQRKGLKMMYRQGCTCGIKRCAYRRCTRNRDACNWDTWHPNKKKDCQRNEGICLRSASRQCLWSKNSALATCSKNATLVQTRFTHHRTNINNKFNSPFHDDPDRKFGQ